MLKQLPGLDDRGAGSSAQEARDADEWYSRIVRDSFGT
jgi:hypothetical protein